MITKEEVQSLQDQVSDDYKYIFKWIEGHTDYEDYLTNGQPDLEKIKDIHQYAESSAKSIDEVFETYSPWNAHILTQSVPNAIWRFISSKN